MTRIIKPRDANKIFKIFVEGKNTEIEYFSGIKKYISDASDKKPTNVKVTIVRLGNNSELVKKAIRDKNNNLEGGGFYFVLLDKDNLLPSNLSMIKNLCRTNHIKLIFTNRSFELWLLLHFECRTKKIGKIDEYSDYLNKKFFNHKLGKTEGSLQKLFPMLSGNINNAIANCQKLRKIHIDDGKIDLISCDVEPFTNLDELIQTLFDEFGI